MRIDVFSAGVCDLLGSDYAAGKWREYGQPGLQCTYPCQFPGVDFSRGQNCASAAMKRERDCH